ncbi:glycoside hydrolase family 93 protein [Talaromyces proteolyticus]|uniref:Glycoside hydrolase family 93 protein n=1 Tax=Talaromyces proteolyticus TaxID=1131652 RepID=A0AAD4PT76_9EURO|nr:glycoside hydrolase family 93 protein [Talaromyces proteolyticus]KAH8692805.1 glycoside hydrolase family 93 protein [Talaromyces proteolyticus]
MNLHIKWAALSTVGNQNLVNPNGEYMRTTTITDGSILGGYAVQEGDNHVLRTAQSTDGGVTWTQLGIVDSGPSATRELDNAFPFQLPSGRLLFAFRNHDRISKDVFTYYRITLCYSDNGGNTWNYLTQIDERAADPNNLNGFWEPYLRLSSNGTLQVFYSSENSAADQDNLMKISIDDGNTWSGEMPVSGQGITARDGMTGGTNIDDNGNLIGIYETTEDGPFSVNYVLSQDDGFTWNTRTRLYTAANGADAGAPQIINVGGTIVADFMTNEDGGQSTTVDSGEMKVITSTGEGQTWSMPTITGNLGSHWPGMYVIDSSHFLALYSLDNVGLITQEYQL